MALLVVIGGAVAAIVLHKKKHNVYVAGVAQGYSGSSGTGCAQSSS